MEKDFKNLKIKAYLGPCYIKKSKKILIEKEKKENNNDKEGDRNE